MEQKTYTIEMVYKDDQLCASGVVDYDITDNFLAASYSNGRVRGFTLTDMITFEVFEEKED